jgi:hypothetical protein
MNILSDNVCAVLLGLSLFACGSSGRGVVVDGAAAVEKKQTVESKPPKESATAVGASKSGVQQRRWLVPG